MPGTEIVRGLTTGARREQSSPWTVLVVMCTGYFLVLLDVTIVNVALPSIATALRAGVGGLQWTVDGYALALAALMLVSGTLGDIGGHRRIVLLGLAVFGAGSLGCGLAPGVAVLVAARVVQGVGAAMLLPGTLAVIIRAFPEAGAQARAIGVWAGVGSLALPAGPLLGGVLIVTLGWRAVFLINVPIVLAAGLLTRKVVRESRARSDRGPDLLGAACAVLLLLAITYAFIEAGHSGAGSPRVIAAGAAAVLLLAGFLRIESRRGSAAMLPLGLFRSRAFCAANGAAGVMNLCTLGTLFVLTLFLQSVQHRSALTAGLCIVPLFVPLAALAPPAGRVTSRIGPRYPATAGLLTAAAGLALLVRAGPGAGYPVLLPAFLLWGIGLGLLTPAVVAAAIGALPGDRSGLASAVSNTSRQTGGAIGIAIAGAIAGQSASPEHFVHGFHTVALASAALYALTAMATLVLLPGTRSSG